MKTLWLLLLFALGPGPAAAPPVQRGILEMVVDPPPGQSVPRELAVRGELSLKLPR